MTCHIVSVCMVRRNVCLLPHTTSSSQIGPASGAAENPLLRLAICPDW
jgi:hypothetical protein